MSERRARETDLEAQGWCAIHRNSHEQTQMIFIPLNSSKRWKDLSDKTGWGRKGPAQIKGEPGAPAELGAGAYLDGNFSVLRKNTNN